MNNPNMNILNIISQMKNSGANPQMFIQQMINQNPQTKMIFNQVQNSGLSMKDYTLQYAKQNNIDINSIIQMMSQFGIKL